MISEFVIGLVGTVVLGWGTFTWQRSERAIELAKAAQDSTGKLELKLAEQYLTKGEFEAQMERLFSTLNRFEEKLDNYAFSQAQTISNLQGKVQTLDRRRDSNG
jgi:hypothetical protein